MASGQTEWEKRVKRVGPPVSVHPSIKLARWVFLTTGIVYGATKQVKYSTMERTLQTDQERTQGTKDKFINDEKSRILENESQLLEDPFFDEEKSPISDEPPEDPSLDE